MLKNHPKEMPSRANAMAHNFGLIYGRKNMCERVPLVFKRFKVEAPTVEIAFIKAQEELVSNFDYDSESDQPGRGYLVLENARQYVNLWGEHKDEPLEWKFAWCKDE